LYNSGIVYTDLKKSGLKRLKIDIMKTIPGTIRITDKVYFEPEGLEKPDSDIYEKAREFNFDCEYYQKIIKEYEASKQKVEVNNVEVVYEWPDEVENPNDDKIYGYSFNFHKPDEKGNTAKMIINNQPCKAEIKDNKATIIELI